MVAVVVKTPAVEQQKGIHPACFLWCECESHRNTTETARILISISLEECRYRLLNKYYLNLNKNNRTNYRMRHDIPTR